MTYGWAGRMLLLGGLCLGAAGCRHKAVVAAIPLPPPSQLPVDTTAKVEHQPVVAAVPVPTAPITPVTVPTRKVKRVKKQAPPAPAPAPPVQVASAAAPAGLAPEVNVIGALTPGGSDVEQQHREAQDLIAALDKRLAELPSEVKKKQKEQLMRVKNFQRQAQAALKAGDADGAWTLATKARLLLDDVVR